jgi:hypothetical protein
MAEECFEAVKEALEERGFQWPGRDPACLEDVLWAIGGFLPMPDPVKEDLEMGSRSRFAKIDYYISSLLTLSPVNQGPGPDTTGYPTESEGGESQLRRELDDVSPDMFNDTPSRVVRGLLHRRAP